MYMLLVVYYKESGILILDSTTINHHAPIYNAAYMRLIIYNAPKIILHVLNTPSKLI